VSSILIHPRQFGVDDSQVDSHSNGRTRMRAMLNGRHARRLFRSPLAVTRANVFGGDLIGVAVRLNQSSCNLSWYSLASL